MKKILFLITVLFCSISSFAQVNTDRVMLIGRNALYFEDYVLAIQYFNQVIKAKPYLPEPYYYRAVAKYYLDDVRGAEEDCSLALERNSFMTRAYQLRGDTRRILEDYDGALADYKVVSHSFPNDKYTLISTGIVNIQKKNYDEAEKELNTLLRIHPSYTEGFLVRGSMYQEKGDTIMAFADYNRAIEQDKYLPQAYSMRGLLYYYKNESDSALADFNEAIHLDPLQTGNYINRGLVRYSKNDLRGAMSDYDKVVELDNNNIIARFNRGLLRSQVGDDNRAIEDFDVVLTFEPNNYLAYFNRALLKNNIGDYNGALEDLNRVLAEYPDFYHGFYFRSEIKRKQNDLQGAERDFNYARNEEGRINRELAAGKEQDMDEKKTREESDKDIDKFNLLVVADKADEEKSKYKSEARGRIQNRQVKLKPEDRFVITYYEKPSEFSRFVYFSQLVDALNRRAALPKKLRITNKEASLNELQIQDHFRSIDELSQRIVNNPDDALLYFARAIDYMLVQDFINSIEDYEKATEIDPDFALAYFNKAVVYAKQTELKESAAEYESVEQKDLNALNSKSKKENKSTSSTSNGNGTVDPKVEYEAIVRAYTKVIELNPDFIYAYYNRAEIRFRQQDYRSAILDYNEALRRDKEFAEAYYNRGLARFYIKDYDRALEDMRKAGELGIVEAYSIIKRMTE